ncbi:MAG: NAD(P)H-dependent oxidoreductase [Mycobacterium sp.]
MPILLYVESSAAEGESVSRVVADVVRDEWRGDVVRRNLAADPIPFITAEHIVARRTDPADLTTELVTATVLQDALIEEFLAADAYLFAVPMYNWSVPASFKAWIDQIVVLHRTLAFPPPTAGRPAVVVSARGGAYGPGTPNDGKDFATPWLQLMLGDTLGLDLQFITPEQALAATMPALATLVPAYEESLGTAKEQARIHGRGLSQRLAA